MGQALIARPGELLPKPSHPPIVGDTVRSWELKKETVCGAVAVIAMSTEVGQRWTWRKAIREVQRNGL